MARTRKSPQATPTKTSKISDTDLIYLTGLFDSTLGLKNVGTVGAVAISDKEDWPKAMAAKFGGVAKEFSSQKGKKFWGWFVPLGRRIELVKMIQEGKHSLGTDIYGFDGILYKLERAVNSTGADAGSGPVEDA